MSRITAIRAQDLHPSIWKAPVTIRFGQCDPAGIVYTPVYFDLFNVTVEEWFSACLGLDYYRIIRERKVGLGYGHAAADFLSPAFMGDMLDIAVAVSAIGTASFTLTLHVMRDEAETARGRLVAVTTSLVEHRPVAIPDDIRAAIERYRDGCR
jgi:4-hydroxybenzoyl-CoA thioesterase/acyl-CoA thioester hydrolase